MNYKLSMFVLVVSSIIAGIVMRSMALDGVPHNEILQQVMPVWVSVPGFIIVSWLYREPK